MTIFDKKNPNYLQCTISVMDNIADSEISFDEKGICNYYYEYLEAAKKDVVKGDDGIAKLADLIEKIKLKGRNKKYDCILGVSGGVDSTYLAYKAKIWGIRPLLVHFDNGWNSEIAVKNIQNIVLKTGFDLYTYVVDWIEFKDIQRSFFEAGVIDIESITDIGFRNALQLINKKYNIGVVIDGQNIVTEWLLPGSWIYKSQDNLINIHRRFGKKRLRTYPIIKPIKKYLFDHLYKLEYFSPLNYMDYNKNEVKEIIKAEVGWVDYGGKHYESVFTRFYQGYILPNKFGVDKRKAHLSNLIFSGQLDKNQALILLKKPIYPPELFELDYAFVLKKLDFTVLDFEKYMKSPVKGHEYYGGFISFWQKYPFLKPLRFLSSVFKRLSFIFK
jgi:N-acetyl sugar amidotransferase